MFGINVQYEVCFDLVLIDETWVAQSSRSSPKEPAAEADLPAARRNTELIQTSTVSLTLVCLLMNAGQPRFPPGIWLPTLPPI